MSEVYQDYQWEQHSEDLLLQMMVLNVVGVFFGEYCAWAVLSCVLVSEFSTN